MIQNRNKSNRKNKRPNKTLEKTLPAHVYYQKFSTDTIPDDDIIFIDIPLTQKSKISQVKI